MIDVSSSDKDEFTLGNSLRELTQALIIKAKGVRLISFVLFNFFNRCLSFSSPVISAKSYWVTCGKLTQLACSLFPEIF